MILLRPQGTIIIPTPVSDPYFLTWTVVALPSMINYSKCFLESKGAVFFLKTKKIVLNFEYG